MQGTAMQSQTAAASMTASRLTPTGTLVAGSSAARHSLIPVGDSSTGGANPLRLLSGSADGNCGVQSLFCRVT